MSCAAENPNRRLRLSALGDRVAILGRPRELRRSRHDDHLGADLGEGPRAGRRGSCCERSPRGRSTRRRTSSRAGPGGSPARRGSCRTAARAPDLPEAKRLLGALTNSRGHRHEENAARLVNVALEQPIHVGAALLASAEAYTPTAQQLIEGARERLGTIEEVASALADNLPQAKPPSGKSRRRRRRKKRRGRRPPRRRAGAASRQREPADEGRPAPKPRPRPPRPNRPLAPGRVLGLFLAARLVLAEEARQLGRERVPGREVELVAQRVAPRLELADVGRRLLVGGHGLADLALVGVRRRARARPGRAARRGGSASGCTARARRLGLAASEA